MQSSRNGFSLLIKPASADCNLRCSYCFYLAKKELYPHDRTHRMDIATLEHLIKGYLATQQPVYTFTWQGGEPTLMGAGFFKRVTDLQKKFARPGSRIANGLQTNATLIDDALAHHLARYNFLVGCSLDGPPQMHDRYRRYSNAKPSHAAVRKGIETLCRHGVEFNILVLVSQANVHQARSVYRYLREEGFYFQQYIPCVEFDKNGRPLPYAINGKEWGRFLCDIFDCWYPQDVQRVSIRYFDALLNKRLGTHAGLCSLANNCCLYFVVEYNGDIYPCDFFVEKNLRLGNVADTTWENALSSPLYAKFGKQKSELSRQCRQCVFLDRCMGDCQKHRQAHKSEEARLSYLCDGWRMFLQHSQPAFEALARWIQSGRETSQAPFPVQVTARSVGRNQPCPCGSGKKYKKCCGG